MRLVFISHQGEQYQSLAPLLSWIIVIGGFLGCVVFLWAWGAQRRNARLVERVRLLELELARLHPRANVDVDPR